MKVIVKDLVCVCTHIWAHTYAHVAVYMSRFSIWLIPCYTGMQYGIMDENDYEHLIMNKCHYICILSILMVLLKY